MISLFLDKPELKIKNMNCLEGFIIVSLCQVISESLWADPRFALCYDCAFLGLFFVIYPLWPQRYRTCWMHYKAIQKRSLLGLTTR